MHISFVGRMHCLVALAYPGPAVQSVTHMGFAGVNFSMGYEGPQPTTLFTTIGLALDPGNVVLSCLLWIWICRSGACVHHAHEEHMDEQCAAYDVMPKLTEILSNCGEATTMSPARLLPPRMQRR